uniref:Transmembrane ascorbate-dependent reductase CYB561 n=1 Tax=Sus scrofa TaxID=9823 RepID=A0A8D0TU50_PIG
MESPAGRTPAPGALPYYVAFSQLLGLTVVAVTGAWLGAYRGGIAWESALQFNVHPLCMIIGLVFLQGDALLVYRVFRNEAKRTTKILHGLLHVLAFVIALVGECLARPALPPPPPTREAAAQLSSPLPLEAGTRPPRSWDQSPQVLASRGSLGSPPPSLPVSPVLTRPPPRPGLVAVFDYHRKKGIADLYSLHSWCGILVFVLFLAQWLVGLGFFLFPGASFSLRSRYRPQHVFFGAAIFLLSVGTALLGLKEALLFQLGTKYSAFESEGILANVLGLLLVAFGAVVLYILTRADWKRPLQAEEQALSMDFKTLTEGDSPSSQ